MPIPDFWGEGGYEGKWILAGQVPDDEEIWMGGQKVDLAELLRPPTDEERRDLSSYYEARANYRPNFVDRFGVMSRYTWKDIEALIDLEFKSGYSEVTLLDFLSLARSIPTRWYILTEYDVWRNNKAGWEEPSDYHKGESKP
ncbi:MAG: hypothetical protein CL468_06365 [Acidimicrobiaceae bacterium]|nr:hypothetical protein [Acidimicrobiaceae bacterium]